MNAVGWTFVGLASAYVALALYGKYRKLKDDFREAREEEARLQESLREDEAEPPS